MQRKPRSRSEPKKEEEMREDETALEPGDKVMLANCPGLPMDELGVKMARKSHKVERVERMPSAPDAVWLEGFPWVFRSTGLTRTDASLEQAVDMAMKALHDAEDVYEALEVEGMKDKVQGYEGRVEAHREALEALRKVRRFV